MKPRDLIERVIQGTAPAQALQEFVGVEVPHMAVQDAREVEQTAKHMADAFGKGDLKAAVLQFEALISALADVAEDMKWPHPIAQGLGQARSQVSMNPDRLWGGHR